MPTLSVKIGEKTYDFGYQEEKDKENLSGLSQKLDERVKEIRKVYSNASEGWIMTLTALNLENELKTAKNNQPSNNSNVTNISQQLNSGNDTKAAVEMAIVEIIEPVSECLENLAKKLETV